MGLVDLRIKNLRILEEVEMVPTAGINLIVGGNGSGKTSVLEAIYLLGRGRSFRGQRIQQVIRTGNDCLEVMGRSDDSNRLVAGIRRCTKESALRINGEPVKKISELARTFPLHLVTPRTHELLERGPEIRRRFLDWGLFHVEPGFHELFRRYQRTLRQRNEALKKQPKTARIWDSQLADWGEKIDDLRLAYLLELSNQLGAIRQDIGPAGHISVTLRKGWPKGLSLSEALEKHAKHDIQQGFTLSGPHRTDVVVTMEGEPVINRLSRGQQKLLVLGLIVAQSTLFSKGNDSRGMLLVDDLAAELDEEARTAVMMLLGNLETQVFVTALPGSKLPIVSADCTVFHVEQGNIRVSSLDSR